MTHGSRWIEARTSSWCKAASQGLASLAQCKTLDSIEIRPAVAIGERATT